VAAQDEAIRDYSRFIAPPVAAGSIRRHELLDAMSVSAARVVWVTAPPGYGKTSLLAQYASEARAAGERVSWLSLELSDQDPQQLSKKLAIADASKPSLLFLDDCHLAASERSAPLLSSLLRNAPASLRIVAAAQGQPAIPLAELELKGQVRRLGTLDLCFSAAETRAYLGEGLDEARLAAVLEKSQGWPIALQLARSQLLKPRGLDSDAPSGSDPTLTRYFTELALDGVAPDISAFMCDTAVLERVNGDVADAIRERSDGWNLLGEVERLGLFLTPCDADGEWFQYHPLFREFLAHRLRRTDAQRERDLRRRAALWLARHEAWPEAIQQAMRSGDIDLAVDIVDRTNHLEVMLRFGGSVLAGLDQLPDEHLARYPRLAMCVAYAHFQEGRLPHARRLLAAIPLPKSDETGYRDRAAETQRDVFEALLEMCEDRCAPGRCEQIESRLVRGELDDPVVRGECCVVLMVSRQDNDDPASALSLSDRLIQETQFIHTPYLDGFGWILRGAAHMARAELGAAQQCYEQCLELSQKFFGRAATHIPIAEILLAEALFERDRFAEAAAPLESGLQRIDSIYGWFELWEPALLTGAPVFARLQGLDKALAFLHQSQASAQMRQLDRIALLCDAVRVATLTRAGQIEEAGSCFLRSSLPLLLQNPLDIRTSRVFTSALLAAHDLATAQHQPERWTEAISSHIAYLRDKGLRRRLLGTLLARARAAEQLGDPDTARSLLKEALSLGASRGFIRIFLESSQQLAATVDRIAAEPFDAATQSEVRTMLASMRERSVPSRAHSGVLLSPREMQVLRLMPEGLTSKEIASRLGVTENTVKGYRRTLFEKLGVTSRSQAIAKARPLRLLP
jgi:LuxR family maltose regulon positive regulatory protein